MALTQVKSDGIATGAVTATQIAANAVTVDDISDGSISTAKLADDAVTADKLANTAVTAGTYGSSSAIPAITVDAQGRITAASTNSVTQVGGANGVDFNDSVKAQFGTDDDLQISHDGAISSVNTFTGDLFLQNYADDRDVELRTDNGSGSVTTYLRCDGSSGEVTLHHYGTQKVKTVSGGIDVTGSVTCDGINIDGNGTLTGGDLTIGSSTDTAVFARLDFEDSGGSGFVNLNAHGTADFKLLHNRSGSAIDGMPNSSGGIATAHAVPIYFTNNNTARAYFDTNGHFRPAANDTYDLGASSERWRNIYTNDLNLSNEGNSNDVDGTWGSWTIQEGEDDLFLLNRRNGKKYKFNLTEVN